MKDTLRLKILVQNADIYKNTKAVGMQNDISNPGLDFLKMSSAEIVNFFFFYLSCSYAKSRTLIAQTCTPYECTHCEVTCTESEAILIEKKSNTLPLFVMLL